MDSKQLVPQFRSIAAEAAEIRRVVEQLFPDISQDVLVADVVREEIARHLYVIRYELDSIPPKHELSDYAEFEEEIGILSTLLTETTNCFAEVMEITTDHLHGIPISDLRNASDNSLSLYLAGMPERVHNVNSGTILLTGTYTEASDMIRSYLMREGFHTVVLHPDESIEDALDVYEVSLICYDCGPDLGQAEKFLVQARGNPLLFDKPVLVCGLDYTEKNAVRMIENGAIDYYVPGRSKRVLSARISAAVMQSRNGYRRQLYIRALELNRYSITKEFNSAAAYVAGLLPQPLKDEAFGIDWVFLPSIELGGDIFGYFRLSPDDLAIYLLDVSGHGLEASLYSVTVMNLLNNRLLRTADFGNPATVLKELNTIFDIEEQNNMYFTAWYGVYNKKSRILRYSSAGSQPAVLCAPGNEPHLLVTEGMVVGVDEDSVYENCQCIIPAGSRLFIFSDGIFEIKKEDDTMMTLEEFVHILAARDEKENCRTFARHIETISKSGQFDDDVSLLEISFF
jgi:sigma-B regulation protein RsbU (phosphoserine phosphatase)